MDPLIEAIYRSGCLVAASNIMQAIRSQGGLGAAQEIVVQTAEELFRAVVPEALLAEPHLDEGPLEQHPDREAFLEDVRRRATQGVSAKDREKIARAEAIANEEEGERLVSEEQLPVVRQ